VDSLTVALGARSYPIHIGPGLIAGSALYSTAAKQILIVSNEVVAPLYLNAVREALGERDVQTVVLPDGERHKTLATFASIVDRLVDSRFHRDCCLVALGGGVVGDVTGYAAASFQRGVDFMQVPTTLLAQVDSSVGGKTAVNHPRAKNMIGAFHQPIAVLADTDTLKTLPPRELAAGLAEVIKYGVIVDAEFFAWLESSIGKLRALDPAALAYAIRRSCEIKAAIVAEDEREHGRRALLNLGHTFGHAIENALGYGEWLHGEAVGTGMVMAATLSARMGLITNADGARLARLVERAGLPVDPPALGVDRYRELMGRDKKVAAGAIRFVLLRGLGDAFVTAAVPDADLAAVLR
jgi:3-dehydroquinate synthase